MKFGENKTCAELCATTIPGHDALFINDRINEEYLVYWEIDGLPIAYVTDKLVDGAQIYQSGFPLGSLAPIDVLSDTRFPLLNALCRTRCSRHSTITTTYGCK